MRARGRRREGPDRRRDPAGADPAEPPDRADRRPRGSSTSSSTPARTTARASRDLFFDELSSRPRTRTSRSRRRPWAPRSGRCSRGARPSCSALLPDPWSSSATPTAGSRRWPPPGRDPDLPHGGRQPLLRLARARGEEPHADRPHLGLAAPVHPAVPRVPAGRGALVAEDPPLGQPDHGHPRALPAQVVGLRRSRPARARGARLRAGDRPPAGDRGLPGAPGGDLRGPAAGGRGHRPADHLEPPSAHPREARAGGDASCTRTSSCTSRSGSSTSCGWRPARAAS